MNFEFSTAAQILFGRGMLEKIGQAATGFGKKALLVIGFSGADLVHLEQLLSASNVSTTKFVVSGEPSIDTIQRARSAALEHGCEMVIGFGGGSAIDTAKATAAMLTNPGHLLDYLEVVGRNQPITQQPAPFIAVPTTAGTGSEVTRNAVLAVPEQKVKVSLRSPMMLARIAIIDPALAVSLPPAVTASTGMDALAQVIEPYVSKRANPFTDLYCREGIVRGARSLQRAFEHGEDLDAREDMSFTSLMGGLALANAGLGAVHGFAGPIGGMFDAPHGAVCACLLPFVVTVNARALAAREPDHPAGLRYREVARLVLKNERATAADLSRWLDELRSSLKIPGLSQFGVRKEHIRDLVEKSAVASSMKANPIVLSTQELEEILEAAL